VDAVVTDPPFFAPAAHYQSRISWGRSWGDMSLLGQCFFDWAKEWKRVIKDDGHLFCFCNDESYPVFYPVVYGLWNFTAALIWDKTRVGLGKVFRHQHEFILWSSNSGAYANGNGKLHSDILCYAPTNSSERDHPVQKPPALMAEIIEVTTRPGALIVDCFMGSGTTGVACVQTGRRFIGIEIDPKYFAIAEKRIAEAQLQLRMEI
jgi:site-specific DNA-methyltransferase (adenine-specific)